MPCWWRVAVLVPESTLGLSAACGEGQPDDEAGDRQDEGGQPDAAPDSRPADQCEGSDEQYDADHCLDDAGTVGRA
jgi:hypothetical protein